MKNYLAKKLPINKSIFKFVVIIFTSLMAEQIKANNNISFEYESQANVYNQILEHNSSSGYAYNNSSILNMLSPLSINGLNSQELQISVNSANLSFLAAPINSNFFITQFFINSIDYNNTNLNSNISGNSLGSNINIITQTASIYKGNNNNNDVGIMANANYNSLNNGISNSLASYYIKNDTSLLIGLNYMFVQNSLNGFKYNSFSRLQNYNYSNLIEFKYAPVENDADISITNLAYGGNSSGNLLNTEASNYFGTNYLTEESAGNIFNVAFNYNPSDPTINYHSQIYLTNQYINYNHSSSLITNPDIKNNGIGYKINNTGNFNWLSNAIQLTYGGGFDYNKTAAGNYNNKSYWTAGDEFNYYAILNNELDLLNLHKLFIATGVTASRMLMNPSDFNKYQSFNLNPTAKLTYKPSSWLNIYGMYSNKARTPHIYEKYIDGKYFIGDNLVTFINNPNLKAERANNFVIGTQTEASNAQNTKIIGFKQEAFYSQINNYISQQYSYENSQNIAQFVNVKTATIKGYNANIYYQLNNLAGNIGYSYITGVDNNGNYLNNLFPQNLSVETSYLFTTINTKLGSRAKMYSKFNKINNHNTTLFNNNSGYGVFDLFVENNSLLNYGSLILGVNNIFNKQYQTPYNSGVVADRSYYVNFTMKF